MFFKNNLIFVLLLCFFSHSQVLSVYKKPAPQSPILGELNHSDWLTEMPIPEKKVKKTYFVKDKKGKRVKRVKYETLVPKEPPQFVPIKSKFGSNYAKRADLARYLERKADISGTYSSSTGSVVLKKSPNNPGLFTIIILNGPELDRAEFEASDLSVKRMKGHHRFTFQEPGCQLNIDLFNWQLKVVEKGCKDYRTPNFSLAGEYFTYTETLREAEVFQFPEIKFTYKKFFWCPEGPDSCEHTKDENGKVTITWSLDGNGFIERKAGKHSHVYRPYERIIPNKSEFYKGEKPIMLKTKRTDMSSEWMIWSYYPKAKRFKMVRAGTRPDAAYTEVFE